MIHKDAELLVQVAAGDEVAFNELFERYKGDLYHYMLKITKSSEVAEEIVMDVFVKLWIGRSLLTGIRSFEAFIHKIAFNKAMNFLKTVSRQARLKEVYIRRLEYNEEEAPDEILINAETRALLQEAIGQLPPKRRSIYLMSREQGLTHQQIAEALHLSIHTVKNSMVSANKSIGEYLIKHLGKAAFLHSFLLL
jgi:RNA polymerase sigma-70 factor (ECF subfamily)